MTMEEMKESDDCCLCLGTEEGNVIHPDCHCRGTIGTIHESCLRAAMATSAGANGRCPTCKMPVLNTAVAHGRLRWAAVLSLHVGASALVGGVAYAVLARTTRASHAANVVGLSLVLAVPNMYWTVFAINDAIDKIAIRSTTLLSTTAMMLGILTFTYHVSLFSVWPNLIAGIIGSARSGADQDWARDAPIRLRV